MIAHFTTREAAESAQEAYKREKPDVITYLYESEEYERRHPR